MKSQIKIFDTTLRDGEQSPGASMSPDQKVKMAVALENLGVDRIEAGFPVSSELQFDAVNKISEVINNSTVVALSRCVKSDIDTAFDALKPANKRMLHLFIATSQVHRRHKLKMEKKDILASIKKSLQYAGKFFKEIEFSAEDATRTDKKFLFEVIETALQNGATTINIPDTVGYSVPGEFFDLINEIKTNFSEFNERDLSVHCHNDLGLAVANSLEAVKAGATQVEVTVNGIGERAGNCSLEEFVMSLKVRQDIFNFDSGINTTAIYKTSSLLQNITGLLIPRNKPIIGDNAFLHEAGIHQHGILSKRETYEIMDPQKIGRNSESLVMGRHSGKNSFREKLLDYNIKLSKKEFDKVFQKFMSLADKKKEVYDREILEILPKDSGRINLGFKLENFYSCTGMGVIPSCTLKLKRDEKEYISSVTGNGPIDALFGALSEAAGIYPELKEYTIQAIGSGTDAQGHVKVVIELGSSVITGRGTSTDILEASAIAYLNAINEYILKMKSRKITEKHPVGISDWPSEEII